ncbi:MAG: hypothetical protein GY751_05940 [Bacteroidetes bacterium]|nr:hypothetical protein [Bacteroidota bacterium]
MSDISAQTFGIGIDVPTANLHIRSTAGMSSIFVDRELAVTASGTYAVRILDESDFRALGVFQEEATNIHPLAYFRQRGEGMGIWSSIPESSNTAPAGRFQHIGSGPAGNFYHTGTGYGTYVEQHGTGHGMVVEMRNLTGTASGIYVEQLGTTGLGMFIDAKNNSDGIINLITYGLGVINVHRADSSTSFIADMAPTVGSSFIGDGFYFTNTDFEAAPSGSDGWGFIGFTNTQTPTVGLDVSGGVLGAEQYGVGHGILINHLGSQGRNAEFNITSLTNTDPAIFATHQGDGSVLIAQQQGASITGVVTVADISFTGTDVDNHIAVYAGSAPASGSGVGVRAHGGYRGVVGSSDVGTLTSAGIYSLDEVAAAGFKPFWIDHPLHPESMILKHFSVESNEVSNMYKGTVTIGNNGRVVVTLPDYFEAINGDCVYQLTAIGTPKQPWIAKEISGNRFVIAGKPKSKVSWVVFANREDRYAQKYSHRAKAEVPKQPHNVGKFLVPALYNQPEEKGIFYREIVEHSASKLENHDTDRGVSSDEFEKLEAQQLMSTPIPPEDDPGIKRQSTTERMTIRKEIKTFDELEIK